MSQPLMVITSMPDLAAAKQLARDLVEQRLAACVSILPSVQSVYHWQGTVQEADELVLLIKTVEARYSELETAIRAMHPYALPEIVALPMVAGLPAYLAWISAETKQDLVI